ncbi:hypothetical protein FACS1894196_3990 [Clostridia bacterium]|nr:hypothetical protein FACS1894196_3990 [Clostridia bacterium]
MPLLTIAGGGGDGDSFLPLADALCGQYKVITYDRRANARSTDTPAEAFSVAQQGRDALAILMAAGEESAFVLGCSSGAMIALEFVRAYPAAVRKILLYEPPENSAWACWGA